MAQLDAFVVGQIKAHVYHGLGPTAIAAIVTKPDNVTHPSVQAVADVIAKLNGKSWRGERASGSGAPRKTTVKVDKMIVKQVFKDRGQQKVTVAYLKKMLPALRKVSDGTVENRLHEAGLLYLKRRRKTLVTKSYLQPRQRFATRVLTLHQNTLNKWAYSDGTVFYLDKSEDGAEHTQRASLGKSIWRLSDRSDALFSDCVGPSSYNKAQGDPVKVWGVLANGQLHITILPKGQHMNRWWYAWIIKRYFPEWLDGSTQLVQDFESCLRCDEPMEELRKLKVELVPDYPKCSQDLNAIENAWKVLRERLEATLPVGLEYRDDFIVRLKNAVRWINANRYDQLLHFCRNQKERATELLSLKGGRTSF